MSIKKVLAAVIIRLICDEIFVVSAVLWPSGNYSLPKPKTGCPKFWKEGWLRQDLDDNAHSDWIVKDRSKFSPNFHMNATLNKEFIERRFCTKVSDTFNSEETNAWPKGLYCIYKKQKCPHSMVEGSITWDDEDSNNGNENNGCLPDFDDGDLSWGRNEDTRLYYCCQNEGKWHEPIELPNENPFYLLPYGSRHCQRVMWAVSSLEYIIYDTEDNGNFDKFVGHHVFTDGVKSLPKIFYCYYEGCQHELRNDAGSFTSPNFVNNSYPDFQFCSWSLKVNISSRILLKFQKLNVPNCDENYLDIFDGFSANGSMLLARLCGRNATSEVKIISRTNNLYIVLKSGNNSLRNAENSSGSIGFYVHYEAFELALTSFPTTTLSPTKLSSNPPNHAIDGWKRDVQNTNDENSAIYLSIFLPLLVILILLGTVGGIFYWKRRNKEKNAATNTAVQMEKEENWDFERYMRNTPPSQTEIYGPYVPTETNTNPIYESEVNTDYESIDKGSIEMHDAAENVLYEPGKELFDGNPIYGIDNDIFINSTNTEPME